MYRPHQRVLEYIESLPGFPALNVLELGCGDGILMEKINQKGVCTVGTTYLAREQDYIRCRDYPSSIKIVEGVDLNGKFPFDDHSFDVVYSTEVIEHLECHANFIAESARVLKPGGWFIMTAPNTSRLASRIHYALTGLLETNRQLIPWDEDFQKLYAYHHRCIDFSVFHWLLWKQGIRIVELRESWISWSSRITYLFAPMIRFSASKLAFHRKGVNEGDPAPSAEDSVGRQDMLKWLNSRCGLLSGHWCILARKLGELPLKK
jgi:SAM-dependent methyltransferase